MRDFMVGTIGVGIVVVDGKTGTEAEFSAGEQLTLVTEIQQGFEIFYKFKGVSLAGITSPLLYMAKIDFVKLDIEPATVLLPSKIESHPDRAAESAVREPLWRDPALQALGLSPGNVGISQYLARLMGDAVWHGAPNPDAAYVVFVTKYNSGWQAYAAPSVGKVVMCYHWLADLTPKELGGFRNTGVGGWGEANLDLVFAHETGHIFGALDEYADSNCSAGQIGGHLHVANGNCEVGNPASVECLMKANTIAFCAPTVAQWGWADRNNDGVLDVFE
jgi:hypothetical protein